MIDWFKKLDYRFHFTAFIGTWTLLWLWTIGIVGNMDWCIFLLGKAFASNCDLDWVNAASVISVLIIWGCGIAALVIYHDHVSDHGIY